MIVIVGTEEVLDKLKEQYPEDAGVFESITFATDRPDDEIIEFLKESGYREDVHYQIKYGGGSYVR